MIQLPNPRAGGVPKKKKTVFTNGSGSHVRQSPQLGARVGRPLAGTFSDRISEVPDLDDGFSDRISMHPKNK